MINKKLQLVYIPEKHMGCIPHPHYKEGVKLIRKWIKQHNKELE